MSFDYTSSFVESISSSEDNASFFLIRDEKNDELILWSKSDVMNKTQMKKTQKKFKKWWYLTSYKTKDVHLTEKDKLRSMRWEEVNQTSDDWHYFIEYARARNDASRLLCRRCDDDITHSSSTWLKISAIKNHRKKKNCTIRETNKYSSTNSMRLMIKINIIIIIFSHDFF